MKLFCAWLTKKSVTQLSDSDSITKCHLKLNHYHSVVWHFFQIVTHHSRAQVFPCKPMGSLAPESSINRSFSLFNQLQILLYNTKIPISITQQSSRLLYNINTKHEFVSDRTSIIASDSSFTKINHTKKNKKKSNARVDKWRICNDWYQSQLY